MAEGRVVTWPSSKRVEGGLSRLLRLGGISESSLYPLFNAKTYSNQLSQDGDSFDKEVQIHEGFGVSKRLFLG